MTPDDHGNHGGHEPQLQNAPAPLLENPTATIYLDGLIYTAYNRNSRVFEGAILTEAKGHHLVIEVRLRGNDELIWPLNSEWDGEHGAVKDGAPFWLYVDSGQRIQQREFSATLHNDNGEQSIKHILSFEQLHERQLPPKPETFALFNFPQGTTYSAENTSAKLKTLPQGASVSSAQFKRNIHISTLTAVDIDAVSNGAGKKYLVLANNNGKDEFFRFELEPGKHYEIKILNRPIALQPLHDPREHFLQFYELFALEEREEMFLVEPPSAPPFISAAQPPLSDGRPPVAAPPNLPHSPPCIATIGNTETGLDG